MKPSTISKDEYAVIGKRGWMELKGNSNHEVKISHGLTGKTNLGVKRIPKIHEEHTEYSVKVLRTLDLQYRVESQPSHILNIAKLGSLIKFAKGEDIAPYIYTSNIIDSTPCKTTFVILSTDTVREYLPDNAEITTIDGIEYYSDGYSAYNLNSHVVFELESDELFSYLEGSNMKTADKFMPY